MVLFGCAFALGPVVAITGDVTLLQIVGLAAIAGVVSALSGALISYVRGSGD